MWMMPSSSSSLKR
jgi:hypothetical protein